jgi:histidinol-phosphate aminotransferase
MAELVLVLGGSRSGKSALAERLVAPAGEVTYVATLAEPGAGQDSAGGMGFDRELAARITAHRARRPSHWRTVQAGDALRPSEAVAAAPPTAAVLVDGTGAWLAGRMAGLGLFDDLVDGDEAEPGAGARLVAEADALAEAARRHPGGPVVVVAEEAGLGVLPAASGTRRWLDLHGELVQALAGAADRVLLVVAGRAVELPPAAERAGERGDAVHGRPPEARAGAWSPAGPNLRAHGDRMVPPGTLDLAVNVRLDPGTGGPPRHLLAAMAAALDGAAAYPDPAPATAAVAARHGRPAGEVLLVAGAAEGFWLLAAAVNARLAAVVHPQFTEPEAALRANGIAVERVARPAAEGWALDPAAVPERADLVVVGNPNNPTGTLDDPERIAALCRPGRVTLVDEAFMDFVPDELASLAGRRELPGLVVARSVTKLWGLAGVRAGWLLGPPGLLARCAARRQPWPLTAPALAAITVCAGDDGFRRAVAAEVAAERAWLAGALRAIPGVAVADGAANFLLLRVPDGPRVHAELLDRGIALRPSTFPGLGPDHLRTTVRDRAASSALVGALTEILAPVEAR